MRAPRTVCFDFDTGIQLAVYAGLMNQVQVGADFYVGQKKYVVKSIEKNKDADGEAAEMIITLKKPEP